MDAGVLLAVTGYRLPGFLDLILRWLSFLAYCSVTVGFMCRVK